MSAIYDFLYNLLHWIYSWVGSWGWAMVVFTIMIRLCMTPLDIKSRAGMRKTTKIQPQMQALQKKYANDKQKLNAKMQELYRKEHVNPMSSCLPMLLTWPILIVVFGAMRMVANRQLLEQVTQILNNQQPNLEQWLWIKNLWMPDNLFYSAFPDANTLRAVSANEWLNWFNKFEGTLPASLQSFSEEWINSIQSDILKNIPETLRTAVCTNGLTADCFSGNNLQGMILLIVEKLKGVDFYASAIRSTGYSIPLIGSVPQLYNGFLLLPILSAVSQIVMTKVMSGNQPQAAVEGQPNTGKFMQWFFPIFSLWICLGYSAAFALYWVAGNLVSMVQTLLINKYLESKEQKAAPVAGEGSVK